MLVWFQAAAQGVISAQELVSGCKKALAAAEHACSDLIGKDLTFSWVASLHACSMPFTWR